MPLIAAMLSSQTAVLTVVSRDLAEAETLEALTSAAQAGLTNHLAPENGLARCPQLLPQGVGETVAVAVRDGVGDGPIVNVRVGVYVGPE